MNTEQENSHHLHSTTPLPLHLQPSALVAVVTLVLAGSAILWKSNLRLGNVSLLPRGLVKDQQALNDEHESHDTSEGSNLNEGSKFHASRSKERRKRRKDPIKELMKGGKKAKDLDKLLKHIDFPSPSDLTSSPAPNSASQSDFLSAQAAQEPSSNTIHLNRMRASRSESRTRDPSVSLSSRSVSISSAAGASARSGPSGDDFEEQDQEEEYPLTAIPPSPALPSEVNSGHSPTTSYDSTPSLAISMFSMESVDTADTSVQSSKYLDLDPVLDEERFEHVRFSATSLPKSASQNNRRNKNSNIRNSTPDNLATNHATDNTHVSPAMLTSSHSMPPNAPCAQSKDTTGSSSSTLNVSTASSSSPLPSQAGKPPRFRSQTRQDPSMGQGTSSSGVGLGFSTSMPIYSTSHTIGSTSKLESDYTDGEHMENGDHSASPAFSYPTLNGNTGSGSVNDSAPGSSKASSNAGVGTPPPGSTNSTSLSTQTQVASLRGALEASRKREEEARGREERSRSELDRLGNDLKVLRWEGNAWRRREGELQTQVQHLMHQLQSYATYFAQPPQFSPQLQNLAIPQPQRASGKHSKGKRPHTQSRTSPTSSRSTSKSSRPSRSSHASPIPPLAQLPEGQAMSQGSSSPSIGSPIVPPSRMFSPSSTFSPGHSSTPFLPNPNAQNMGPFSPSSSFGMFSPTGLPGGMPFASPHPGYAGVMSPLSPQSPYFPYPTYPAFGGFSQGPNQTNGNGSSSNGGKMHPVQFLNTLNNTAKAAGAGAGSGTEPGGTMSVSSTMSSLNSLTSDSTGSVSPEFTSPSPAPGPSTERGRKRGRGAMTGTETSDRSMGGYGSEYHQYGYSYGYPYPYSVPNPFHEYTGTASVQGEHGKESDEPSEGKNSFDSDAEHDVEGEVNELLAGSILKRPESMMGLRRSGSGGSSKSKSKLAQEKLRMSPMKDMGIGNEMREGQQLGDDGLSVASPSSDSGVVLTQGLDWLHDPALFRRDSSEAISSQRSPPGIEAITLSMPSSPPQPNFPFPSNTIPTEIELDSSSSSSSSTKSNSESTSTTDLSDAAADTPAIEFTFPSIATWGYSYRTHSVGDVGDHERSVKARVDVEDLDKDVMNDHYDGGDSGEQEITPLVDKMSPMSVDSNHGSSDSTIVINPGFDNEHDGTRLADEERKAN
ncbi:hypothetical protein GGU11DRAFT_91080 [Lentinula aff. detonsa]|nr:hypothetical protein GGU11DRAFT_91080 [Lentinula aff. detonsa]